MHNYHLTASTRTYQGYSNGYYRYSTRTTSIGGTSYQHNNFGTKTYEGRTNSFTYGW